MLTTSRILGTVLVVSVAVVPVVGTASWTKPDGLFGDPAAAAAHAKPTQRPHPTATPRPSPTAAPTPSPTPNPTATPIPTATPSPTPTPSPTATPSTCTLFPSTNVWNEDISTLPVRSDSAAMITAIGASAPLHPDFSSTAYNGGLGYGIPFNVTGSSTPKYTVSFAYADESDPGPYPIPASPKIEGGSDRHLLSWDANACSLYELYDAVYTGGQWTAGSGAIWDLRSNALRPAGWTSADAAGLPILPGLIRYGEVAAGAIGHALRFTAPYSAKSYIYPARHEAGCTGTSCLPPMGLRLRLKASVNISSFSAADQVILLALKRYGMLLADNGSSMYVTGSPDPRWDDDDLHVLTTLHGSDFEAVDTTGLVNG